MIRKLAPSFALLVAPLFCLYCAKPTVNRRAGLEMTGAENDARGKHRGFSQTGYASWYGGGDDGFSYRQTANGEIMDPEASTCAHPFLPFGTVVMVENLSNGRSTVLRVNDRGPYINGRIIDITPLAAEEIGMTSKGVSKVRLRVIQDLVRTTRVICYRDIGLKQPSLSKQDCYELQEEIPVLAAQTAKDIDTSALFAQLSNLSGRHTANVANAGLTCFYTALKDFEENAERIKNRRSDPFINRIG